MPVIWYMFWAMVLLYVKSCDDWQYLDNHPSTQEIIVLMVMYFAVSFFNSVVKELV